MHKLHLFSSRQLVAVLLQGMQAAWLGPLNYMDIATHAYQPVLRQPTVLSGKLTAVPHLKCITWLLVPIVCRVLTE